MTQLLSIAPAFRPPLLHIFPSALLLEAQGLSLSQSLPHALTLFSFFVRELSLFSLLFSNHFSSSFHTYFYQLSDSEHYNSAHVFYYFLSSMFISSSLQSTSTLPALYISYILPLISSHPISPHLFPPAVAEDDKPPYTILCALDKHCSVEGVGGWGVGVGWGPPEN